MRPLALCALLLAAACAKEDAAPPAASSAGPAASAPAPSAARASDVVATSLGELRVTPLHHATFLLQVGGKAIYFDPVHDASYDGLPKADAVFITDIHPDHLDAKGLDLVTRPDTVIVVPPAVAEKLEPGHAHVTILKNGESAADRSLLPGLPALTVLAVPMYNLTRGPAPGALYHDKGRGNGYVLTVGDKRLYVSGDTECTPEMRALKDIDVAFVCMNLPYTMPPSEAAACINAFHPKVVYPYHDRNSDLGELQKAVVPGSGIEVRVRDWYAK